METVEQLAQADNALEEAPSYRTITIINTDGSTRKIQVDINRAGAPVFQADINHMIITDPTDPANIIAINLTMTDVVAIGYDLT